MYFLQDIDLIGDRLLPMQQLQINMTWQDMMKHIVWPLTDE